MLDFVRLSFIRDRFIPIVFSRMPFVLLIAGTERVVSLCVEIRQELAEAFFLLTQLILVQETVINKRSKKKIATTDRRKTY